MKNTITHWASHAFGYLRSLGPYLAIELIMPGGSLLALGLWFYRHRQQKVPL